MLWRLPEDNLSKKQAQSALRIAKEIFDSGYPTYLVGGGVRDSLLGIPSPDMDLCTSCPADKIVNLFPNAEPWGLQKYSVFRIKTEIGYIEIAHFREERNCDGRHCEVNLVGDLERDIYRRDFTVNALAVDPNSMEMIDMVGGLLDVSAKIIRTIGDAERRFAEDKLRLLRAIRFAGKLDFEFAEDTYGAINQQAKSITELSWERIREELHRIFTGNLPNRGLNLLNTTGLWNHIFPELGYSFESHAWKRKLVNVARLSNLDFNCNYLWAMIIVPENNLEKKDIENTKAIVSRFKFDRKSSKEINGIVRKLYYTENYQVLDSKEILDLIDSKEYHKILKLHRLRNPESNLQTIISRKFPRIGTEPFLKREELKKILESINSAKIAEKLRNLRIMELSGEINSPTEAKKYLFR